MQLKVGQIVKLKDYSEFTKYKKDVGIIRCINEETVDIDWIENIYKSATVKKENCIVIKTHYTKIISRTLKIGDIVVTNSDGENKQERYILGKVGHITEYALYIWNNCQTGESGGVQPIGYNFSWMIQDNASGKLGIVRKNVILEVNQAICEECNAVVLKSDLKDGLDEHKYCQDCYEHLHCKCEECDELIFKDKDFLGADGKYYCETCWNEEFMKCCDCGEVMHKDDTTYSEITEEYYCESCYSEKFCTCTHCDEEIRKDNRSIDPNGNFLCGDCWSDRCCSCQECDTVIWTDDAHWDEENEEYLCDVCYGEQKTKNIHDYEFRPEAILKKEKWEDELYLGVELEVQHEEYKYKSDKFIEFLEKENVENRLYLKKDRSIGDGFEIVTHPSTLGYMHKKHKWQKIIKWLKKEDFDSSESGSCGIHIHLSKKFFEDLDIVKMRLFFKKNEKELKIFSKREGDGEEYCRFETISDKEIINHHEQNARYWALNLNSSRETLEIRLFRSTLDYERFLAIMQFADAISRFVKKIGITAFLYGEGKYRNNSWTLFVDWCKQENRYKDMIKYFVKEKLATEEKLQCV